METRPPGYAVAVDPGAVDAGRSPHASHARYRSGAGAHEEALEL